MSIWNYRTNFAYDNPLDPDDPRRVNLNEARGDYSRNRLLRELGIELSANCLRDVPSGKCILFGGHRGCGKSTELRAIAADLTGSERFFVIEIDALKDLDINNLSYADVALSLAESLATGASQAGIKVPEVFLSPMRDWFHQVAKSTLTESTASAELSAGAQAEGGLPFIGTLFARLTTAIRSNTTHKTEIRENVRNAFSTLADAFNKLLAFLQDEVCHQRKGKTVIFVIDGTDRLRGNEADDFFIRDIHQLRLLRANCIYCAPISVLNEQGQIAQNFDALFRLPMVKLAEKGKATLENARIPIAWKRMREFVVKRMPMENFDAPETLDRLITHSGGHPRDLLRLVNLCFQEIDNGPITREVAETAARRLSNEYRRLVQPADLPVLVEIDYANADYVPATEQTRRLLYDLVLLEYNSYWWQSHPAVSALEAYRAESRHQYP